MTDNFQDIAQGIVDGINSLFPGHPAAPAPVGHVTVPVTQPPAMPSITPAVGEHKPCCVKSGVWTVASMTAEILRNEGGYVNDPSDSGGATNFGITLGFVTAHREFFGLQAKPGVIDAEDVKHITPTQAANAYIKYFYQAAHYDLVPNVANLVMQLYDMAVNMGVRYSDGESQATKVLQHAIGIQTITGLLDQKTLDILATRLQTAGANVVNNNLVNARINFYKQVVAAHPKDAKFLDGWTKRAIRYHA